MPRRPASLRASTRRSALESSPDETHAENSPARAVRDDFMPEVPGIDVVEGELMPRGAAAREQPSELPGPIA